MKRLSRFLLCAATAALFQIATAPGAFAGPILGLDLATFAVLGATEVTNVPTSTIGGNLGAASGTSIGGGYTFTSGSAQIPSPTSLSSSAQLQLDDAIDDLNSMGPVITLTDGDLTQAGTLNPGVYKVPFAVSNLTGALTLDGLDDVNAVWVFLFPSSSLITSTDSVVNLINPGAAPGVYWNVGSSATLNTGTTFLGNILAVTSITMGDGVTINCGRALAANGNVTLIHDTISIGCLGELAGSGGLDQGVDIGTGGGPPGPDIPPVPVPEPASLTLLATGLLGLARWKRRQIGSGRP